MQKCQKTECQNPVKPPGIVYCKAHRRTRRLRMKKYVNDNPDVKLKRNKKHFKRYTLESKTDKAKAYRAQRLEGRYYREAMALSGVRPCY